MIYNLAPEIFWIGPLIVALILRPVVGIVLIVLAIKTFRHDKTSTKSPILWTVSAIYALLGICLFFGLLTQHAALVGIVFVGATLTLRRCARELYHESISFYFLLIAIFLSLFVTGAGPLSLDSPL